MSDKA